MKIGGLQKTTLIDYPGKIACTVFLIGCNFRCPWCYNPDLVLPEKISPHGRSPEGRKKQAEISEKYFFDFLKKRKGLLEGVVICGGEPTINKELPNFIKKIKKLDYFVKLDTNGSNPEMLKDLIEKKIIDYIALDIKAPLKTKNLKNYKEATGIKINPNKIKKSIELIKNSGIDYEFRTTVLPGPHPKENILEIVKEITPARKYFLQNFRPEKTIDPKYKKYKPCSQKELESIQKECEKHLPTKIRI